MRRAIRDWWRLDSWPERRQVWLPRSSLTIHEPGSRVGGGQLFHQRFDHLFRRPVAHLHRTAMPAFEVRVHVGRTVLHRVSVDRGLEIVGQHPFGLVLALPRHDLGRNVLPEQDLELSHQASTSSANRSSSSPNPTSTISSGSSRYAAIVSAFSASRGFGACRKYMSAS